MSRFTGGCHCGAIRYECSAQPGFARHCQCSDCRRLSGSGHVSSLDVPLAGLRITGKPKSYDTQAESGNTVSRKFCGDCGAPVYSTNSGAPEMAFLRASSLDYPSVFAPQAVVWSSEAAAWDYVDPDLPRFAKGRPVTKA